mmetsp:Transcript_30859/g.100610  ORF Transcript_30859/g.100610 Transcript_30859/m.100610 type:complete len:437 (+) Transcript_30859:1-1311(+)
MSLAAFLPTLPRLRLSDLWPSNVTMDRDRWAAALGVTAFALWYSRRVRAPKVRAPTGDDAESRQTQRIVEDCPQLRKMYYPFPLDFPNLNTFLSYFWRPLYIWAPTPARHQLVVAEDGGTLALVWFEGPSTREDAPLVVLCPGNLGGWFAPYLRRVIYMCRARGFRAVVFVRRGADGNDLSTPKPQLYTDISDFELVMSEIQQQFPRAPLLGAGFSLGGNYLARYCGILGREGRRCPFTSCICVANPFTLLRTSFYLEDYAPFASFCLHTDCKLMVWRNRDMLRRRVDIPALMRTKSYRDLCEQLHCVVHGVDDLDALLRESSCAEVLEFIKVPTLFVNSADDPIVHPTMIPHHEFGRNGNPNLVLAVTKTGGHHAYMGLNPFTPSYMDRLVLEWFESALQHAAPPKGQLEEELGPEMMETQGPSGAAAAAGSVGV